MQNRRFLVLAETRDGVNGIYTQDSSNPPADEQMHQYSTWPGGALAWDDAGNLLHFNKGATSLEFFVHDAEGWVVAVQGFIVNSHATPGIDRRW